MTRILLCVGEPILAKGLESVLRKAGDFELLPTCCGMPAMTEQLSQGASPDLVLLDLTEDVTFAVMSELKKSVGSAKVILWVKSVSMELAFQALGLGVRGILRKQLPAEVQVKCLQKVRAGELWFEKALTDGFLSSRRVSLTHREGQLVSLLAQGMKNKEIAATLNIADGSVKVYLSRLFEKAGVKDRFELALFGLRNLTNGGQLPNEEPSGTGARPVLGIRSLVMPRPQLPLEYAAVNPRPGTV
ncbi:MAG: response regulator transcription factor [Candidatus Sulfopaludibacter sp.]|nr:response regulator transcription factor [Candidatus Sulfopaludibacter sp.]